VRKIKKSEGTGSGVKDVYVSKWKFFEECSFLDEVICAKQNTMTNVEEFQDYHVVDDNPDTATETESVQSVASSGGKRKNSCDDPGITTETESVPSSNGKRKKSGDNSFLETAANALRDLAQASSTEEVEDEWDIFGKDVANSLRNLGDRNLQRKVKFAVQSAIFQATEPPMTAFHQQYAFNDSGSFTAQLRSSF